MGRIKKYFDEYEEYRLYQETFGKDDYDDEDFCENHIPMKAKKPKRPLTEEELERNSKVVRIVFITIGIVFAVLTLWNNIGWLFFLPQFASWPGIIISIIVLVLIVKNINYHRKERKKGKSE